MKRRVLLAANLIFAVTNLSICSLAFAEESDGKELAAPCRLASTEAAQGIDGATSGASYDAALAALKRTVEAFVISNGERSDASLHCLNSMAGTLLHLGERVSASAVYRRAMEVARKVNGDDDDSTLTMQGNLAVTLTGMGLLDEAAKLQADTLARREVLDGTPSAHKLAITLLNLASVESARGDLVQAQLHAKRGLDMAKKYLPASDQKMGLALHNYALVLDRVGARSQAQDFFERALTARLESGDATGMIDSLASLAASLFDVGRFNESDRRYEEAYDVGRRMLPPLHPVRAQIARSWCRVLNSVGKGDASLQKCEEAIQIWKMRDDPSGAELYLTQVNLGITLGLLGRGREAVETLRAAVQGLSRVLPPNSAEVLEAVRALGIVLVESGEIREGAKLLAASFKEQRTLLGELHPDVLLAQGNFGVVLAMQGQLQEAEAVLSDYAVKADTMRGLYGTDERTTRGVFSRFAATRMFLAKVLIVQGRCAEAFDWMENTKARSLLDRLRDRVSLDQASRLGREKLAVLEQTRMRLYVERARAQGDGARQTEIDRRLRLVGDEIASIIEAAHARHPTQPVTEKPSEQMKRRGVAANTMIVSFGLADDSVLIVSYRAARGFQCKTLDNWTGLADTVEATRALQSTPGGIAGLLAGTSTAPPRRLVRTGTRSFAVIPRSASIPVGATTVNSSDVLLDAVGQELWSWLVGSAGAATRLEVSSDGLLNLIALDALRLRGQALVKSFSLSHVISFATAPTTRSRRDTRAAAVQSMIAFGDALYGLPDTTASTVESARNAASIVRGGLDTNTRNWPKLPSSALELRSLTSMFGLLQGKSLFARDMATTRNLVALSEKGELAKARYLVFSTHAAADLSDPELSSIVLSIPSGGSMREAYFTAAELASLDLRSELVFFSACETGYGQVVAGEGVLGLSAAAMTAGAQSTIHTLWSVVDSASAEFTTRFFESVRKGRSVEDALTSTKRRFASDTTRASPAYWAPYVLVRK